MQFCDVSMQAQSEGQEALLAPAIMCPVIHLSKEMNSCDDKGGGEMASLYVFR